MKYKKYRCNKCKYEWKNVIEDKVCKKCNSNDISDIGKIYSEFSKFVDEYLMNKGSRK